MTIDAFAEKFRLKVTRDECNDKIIQGRKGHLYVDAGKLCAMWIDARINPQRLALLGGKQWISEFTLDARRHRLRDAKVTGIPPENHALAIRLTGTRIKRILNEEQLKVLARIRPAQFQTRGATA